MFLKCIGGGAPAPVLTPVEVIKNGQLQSGFTASGNYEQKTTSFQINSGGARINETINVRGLSVARLTCTLHDQTKPMTVKLYNAGTPVTMTATYDTQHTYTADISALDDIEVAFEITGDFCAIATLTFDFT